MIKIINKIDKDISDIILEVDGVKNLSPKGSIPLFNLTSLARRKILYIKEFNKCDTNALYAHRTKLFNDSNIIEESKKYEKIRVSIRITCPYYNTSLIVSKDYDVKQDILSPKHRFNTGDTNSITAG